MTVSLGTDVNGCSRARDGKHAGGSRAHRPPPTANLRTQSQRHLFSKAGSAPKTTKISTHPNLLQTAARSIKMGVFEGAFPQWAYLVGYNTVSALLWLSILAWSALTATTAGPADVYPTVRVLLLSAQGLAALEILHALIGALAQPALPHPNPRPARR